MELCDLGSLDRFLRREEGKSDRRAMAIDFLIQAAQGIACTHSRGIVHGDLKCDNVLVTGSTTAVPQAKVCDFDRSFNWHALRLQGLTDGSAIAAGVLITGAIPWLAPECVQGRLPSPAFDVYAFGMTL